MKYHVETRPKKGETFNGDSYIIREDEDAALFGVIDGLGHGPKAYDAAQAAVGLFGEYAGLSLDLMFEAVHKGMAQTRGVVASVLRFETQKCSLECAGIGNVEIRSTNNAIKPITYGGILGQIRKRPAVFRYVYRPADVFVVFSDGISTRFDITDFANLDCEIMARRILERHGKDHDDATVMVIEV